MGLCEKINVTITAVTGDELQRAYDAIVGDLQRRSSQNLKFKDEETGSITYGNDFGDFIIHQPSETRGLTVEATRGFRACLDQYVVNTLSKVEGDFHIDPAGSGKYRAISIPVQQPHQYN